MKYCIAAGLVGASLFMQQRGGVGTGANTPQEALLGIIQANKVVRAEDLDANGVNDYWTKDVAGFFGLSGANGKPLMLIPEGVAKADRSAKKGKYGDLAEGDSWQGYYFYAIRAYTDGGKEFAYSDGAGRNLSKFGFAAVPARYPESGKLTYVISEDYDIYEKDTKGKVPDVFPDRLAEDGWEKSKRQ